MKIKIRSEVITMEIFTANLALKAAGTVIGTILPFIVVGVLYNVIKIKVCSLFSRF